jgi:iron complex outermembrane recepter protein
MNFSILKVYIVLCALFFIAIKTQAQEKTIIIKDSTSQEAIQQVSFSYNGHKGKGNKLGQISFHYREGSSLVLSHISYNELFLSGRELEQAIQTGVIFLQPAVEQILSPVSVYALKGKKPQKSVRLENGDWVQHDAGQVLQQIPGFSAVRKSGAFGFDPVYRGFKQEQLNILNDGALNSIAACPNRMDPPTSQVMINQVQQVEILRGPHSFRYGPAMGAIINFKSAEPEFRDTTSYFGRINTGFETNGEVYRTEGMAGMRNQKLQISASGSYSKGHEYKDGDGTTIPAGFSRGAAGLNAALKLPKNQALQLTASRNFARKTAFPTLMMDLLSDDTWMLQASYKISPQMKWYKNWHVQLYTSAVDHSMGNKMRRKVLSHLRMLLPKLWAAGQSLPFKKITMLLMLVLM